MLSTLGALFYLMLITIPVLQIRILKLRLIKFSNSCIVDK